MEVRRRCDGGASNSAIPVSTQTMVPQKSLADGETDNESGIYKTVEFRMFCFKVGNATLDDDLVVLCAFLYI